MSIPWQPPDWQSQPGAERRDTPWSAPPWQEPTANAGQEYRPPPTDPLAFLKGPVPWDPFAPGPPSQDALGEVFGPIGQSFGQAMGRVSLEPGRQDVGSLLDLLGTIVGTPGRAIDVAARARTPLVSQA